VLERGGRLGSGACASGVTIVVADDHPLELASLSRAIRQHGAMELVGEAVGGRAALTVIREQRPGVGVVDLQMPGLDGNDIIDAVVRESLPTRVVLLSGALDSAAAYQALPRLAVVFVSGFTHEIAMSADSDGPPVTFVEKPFSAARLTQAVSDVLTARSG
jgi:DNA-binding NarL/FixJ family response regulator